MAVNMTRRSYFEQLASEWDGFTDGERVRETLTAILREVPFGPEEHVIDLGCGTGNLTVVLARLLGPKAVISAVDFAFRMVETARAKVRDPRVRWIVADAMRLPLGTASVDRILCFSAWPHFPDPAGVATELGRVLVPGGMLHLLHIDSREKINGIHAGVGGAISHDLLPPADELADLLGRRGFSVHEYIDSREAYGITAERAA